MLNKIDPKNNSPYIIIKLIPKIMSQQIWLIELLVVLTLMIHQTTSISTPLSEFCPNTTMFVNNSAYQTNLNALFHSLSTNATDNPTGFYQAVIDDPATEAIYGQYLCRGDQNNVSCYDCVTTATTIDLPTTYCPNRKTAIIWYDECMVRYSNEPFFKKMYQSPSTLYMNTMNIIGNATWFMELLENMMNNVIAHQAADGWPLRKFTVGSVNFTSFQSIYGLGQCTPDLTRDDCDMCLKVSIQELPIRLGSQVIKPSCIVRYETYLFFNQSYLPQSESNPITKPISSSSGKKKVSTKVLVSIIVTTTLIAFSISAAFLSIYLCLRRKKTRKLDAITNAEISDQDFSAESLQYDIATLLNATNNFSDENKLGQGGFGAVYKGTLADGRLIAVKRLSASSSQGVQEFKTEVVMLAKLQHRNLVRLLGFCYAGQEKLLVYEYIANKGLDNFLFGHGNRGQLNWQRRYNIVRGIARGLLYLHHDSQFRIVHRDLKASNILLDEEMNPKISDFGTSRILGVDESRSNHTSRVIGTYGYMAPEYVFQGRFSIKSDVYSFGVLVLEIISGRRIGTFNQPGETEDLLTHVWKLWEAGTPVECIDPAIKDTCSNDTEVIRCIHLGLLCVQDSSNDRPTMANVVLTLDSLSATLPLPRKPTFLVGNRVQSSQSSPLSMNDITITEPEPR